MLLTLPLFASASGMTHGVASTMTSDVMCGATYGVTSAVAQEKPPPPLSPPAGPPAIPADAPPVRLWHADAGTTRYGDDIFRDVYCNTLDRVVTFEWRNSVSVPPSYVVRTHTSESFKIDYWPTFVRVIGDGNMFVTGKTTDGGAILERWIFSMMRRGVSACPPSFQACAC